MMSSEGPRTPRSQSRLMLAIVGLAIVALFQSALVPSIVRRAVPRKQI
jgi:hypothetical protein